MDGAGSVYDGRGVVHVSYHMFGLIDHDWPVPSLPSINGLVATDVGATLIYTGIHSGAVTVSVEVRDAVPEQVDIDSWDDVVDVSWETRRG